MTPERILNDLAVSEGLPRNAMAAAGERCEEMIPHFLDHIDRLRHARLDTVSQADISAFLFVFFLLGEWRDGRAYRPLTALLRHDSEFLEELLGDALTEATARVIAGVCDGDLQPILEVIEDPAADEFVRCQMIDALVMIANLRPEARPSVTEYLESFFSADIDKPELLWGSWAFAIAELGLAHMEPQVRQAFEGGWISPDEANFDLFKKELQEAVRSGSSGWFRRSRNNRLIESAIDELSDWHCFSESYLKERAAERSADSELRFLGGTFQHTTPKPGRNAPCPCGSGKKYKKCCLH